MAKKHPKKTKIDHVIDYNIAKIRKKRASKGNINAIILDNTLLLETLKEVESLVPGGASGFVSKKSAELAAKQRRAERYNRGKAKERLERIKNHRKRLEKKQKEEVLELKKARESRISKLKAEIETLVDQRTFAQKKGKDTPRLKKKLRNAEKKLNILTKDWVSNRPLNSLIELEGRIKQAKNIEEANQVVEQLLEKLAEMQRTNKDNRWEEEIFRVTQQLENTEKNINKSVTDLTNYLDKEFYSNILQQKLEADIEHYIQGTRISQPKGSAAAAEPEAEPEAAAEPEFDDIKALLEELRKYAHGKLKRSGSTLRVLQKGLGFNIKKFANDSELLSRWVKEDDGSHVFINNIFDFLINKGFFARNPSKANPDWVIWQKGIGDYLKLLKDYGLQPDSWGLNNQPGAAAEPETEPEAEPEATAEPETGAEKSPKEQALENVSKIEDPSLRKFAFINNFLSGNNGAPLTEELAYSTERYERRYGKKFRAQLQDILKYLRSLQQQAEKMLGKAPQGLSSSNLGTNPRLKQLAPELSEENLDAANKIYRDLWMENVVSYKDLIATVVDLHIKGALRGKNIRAFFDDNVSKYAENPMLLKQYEQKQKPPEDANNDELSLDDITKLQDFFQEDKKTISNITDRLMEQLYDTLN